MNFVMSVVALAAVFAGYMLIARLYRWSGRPAWVDREMVVMLVCVAVTGCIAGALGAVIINASALPLPVWGDAVSTLAVILAVLVLVRLAFRAVAPRTGNPDTT